MNTEEKLQAVTEALELVCHAQELVDDAVHGDHALESNYKAYGRYGFDQLLGNGNPYDEGLHTLLKELAK